MSTQHPGGTSTGNKSKFKPDLNARVALEARQGDTSPTELAKIYQVHPAQMARRCGSMLTTLARPRRFDRHSVYANLLLERAGTVVYDERLYEESRTVRCSHCSLSDAQSSGSP